MIPDVIFLLYFARFEAAKKRSEIAKNQNLKVKPIKLRVEFLGIEFKFSDTRRNKGKVQESKTYRKRENDCSFVGRKCWASSLECKNC